jgi:hypothetical protein
MVRDNLTGEAASLGGCLLRDRDKQRAEIFQNRTQANANRF